MNVFVTGCTGYIGSHTCVELLNNNYNVIGLDNFSNSKIEVLDNIEKITNKRITFYEGDMLCESTLDKIFKENKIDIVIDFAAFKSVGNSVNMPIDYYINNVSSVLTLLKVMEKYDVKSIIYSSSATVYGQNNLMPVNENSEVGNTTNPYGTSKLFCEKILEDLYKSDHRWNICIFRYFNPVGAHPTGIIGENPKDIPTNLMPLICKTVMGEIEYLNIFGDDYDTYDGTGVRDYIHVVDLAKAHVKGIEKLEMDKHGLHIYNLGTRKGVSVFELINTYERVNNVKVNYKIVNRREGDVAICYADASKALRELNWETSLSLEDMCKDAYNYVKKTS